MSVHCFPVPGLQGRLMNTLPRKVVTHRTFNAEKALVGDYVISAWLVAELGKASHLSVQ